jgi:DNA-binding SARP family transcriptional activator
MNNRKIFEEGLLQAMDALAEESKDNTTKMLADLLKSDILKPYKEAYYQELAQGKVHKENVEKAVDFYFSEICASFRAFPNVTDEEKDKEIRVAKLHLSTLKQTVLNVLANNNIVIIQ